MTNHTDRAATTGRWAAGDDPLGEDFCLDVRHGPCRVLPADLVDDRATARPRIERPEAQAAANALEALRAERDELWGALVAVKLWRQTVGLGGGSLWDQVDDALAPEPVEPVTDRRLS